MTNADVPFGKYRLHRRIGAGGMGEVWLATLPGAGGIDKACVVKRLLSRHVLDPDHVRMFLDEARIAISLQHGNVVPVLDFGEVEGTYYIAMDHVRGKDLAQVLRRARRTSVPVPLPVALFVALEVCRGLAYVHEKTAADGTVLGLVHRDVSPANILCSYEGDVKVTDFGIARTRARVEQTALHQLKGKVPYMSPEQARGERVDARTDQWAAAAVLYEALTGVRPHEDPDKLRMLEARRAGAPVPPASALRPDLPGELVAVLSRALSPRADERYARTRDLQIELAQVMARVAPRTTSADLTDMLRRLFPPGADTGLATSPEAMLLDSEDLEPADDEADDDLADPPTAAVRMAPERWTQDDGPVVAGRVTESAAAPLRPAATRRPGRWVMATAVAAFALTAGLTWWSGSVPRAGTTEVARPAGVAPPPSPVAPAPAAARPPPADEPAAPAVPPPAAARAEDEDSAAVPAPSAAGERALPLTGRLEVISMPWAEVWVDGRRRAESTPVTLRLPVGTHQVRLENPELGLRRVERVEIRAGETTRLARRLR